MWNVAASNIIVILVNMPEEIKVVSSLDTFGCINLEAFRFLFQNVTSIGVARVLALYTLQYLVFVFLNLKQCDRILHCRLLRASMSAPFLGDLPGFRIRGAGTFNFTTGLLPGASLKMRQASLNNLKLDVNGQYFLCLPIKQRTNLYTPWHKLHCSVS
jgi:hypothetical protein